MLKKYKINKESRRLLPTVSFSFLFLCSTPSFLYAPDYDPRAALMSAQGSHEEAPNAGRASGHDQAPEHNLPAGVSFYLNQYGNPIPVLGTDRHVLKFMYVGPGLVQED